MGVHSESGRARLSAGARLAESLVALTGDEAAARVRADGFSPQIVPPSAEAVTADLRVGRIRLYVDEGGIVTRATSG